ncbi:MAG: DegV family protein [Christensenellales bacterium]|jgi:DegV family protein with EDD domain
MEYVLMTDSNSEIPYTMADEYDITCILMQYTIDGEEYFYDLGRHTDIDQFYQRVTMGAAVSTAQRNPQDFVDFWRPMLEAGKDILYIAFSSQLSGTYNCALMAREEVLAEFSERRVEIVDTLAISFCEGQLVYQAAQMRKAGSSLDQVRDWVEENKQHAMAYFMVDSLVYLKRGGRVSGTAAAMGTLLDIKPMLHVSAEGKLEPVEKLKGRKKAIKRMVEMLREKRVDERYPVAIKHAVCEQDAQAIRQELEKHYSFPEIFIHPIGPVIGSHVGPGTLALVFMGQETR